MRGEEIWKEQALTIKEVYHARREPAGNALPAGTAI